MIKGMPRLCTGMLCPGRQCLMYRLEVVPVATFGSVKRPFLSALH